MQSPEKCKILLIDGQNDIFQAALRQVPQCQRQEQLQCAHLYEAVSILSDLPEELPLITAGMIGEFMRENGSFFSLLSKRSNLLCIALDPFTRDYPYLLRQAIWNGQLLICKSLEEMEQALCMALTESPSAHSNHRLPEKLTEAMDYKVSLEELNALFNPE